MKKRVVVTGMAGISPIGNDWESIFTKLKTYTNAVKTMDEWKDYEGLYTLLAAPVENPALSENFDRKNTRSMDKVSLFAVSATEKALIDANLLNNPILKDGTCGVAYGSSAGGFNAMIDLISLFSSKNTKGINANTYIKMMGHTTAVNIAVFFGITGRIITTSSACTSSSQAIGYSYESIKNGYQKIMIAGGAEELSVADAAIFDTLFATSTKNDSPKDTPRPFDKDSDGLVLGEGAGTFILEELEHAQNRGAKIYAEVVGYATNCDGTHITKPNYFTMKKVMELALKDANLEPKQIGYINAHGTATKQGDIAETRATYEIFANKTPISSLKSYTGHTLGACGALEAMTAIKMMQESWFHPTINLQNISADCANLDYIIGEGRTINCEYVMSNNFAFGGINTSLIFKKFN